MHRMWFWKLMYCKIALFCFAEGWQTAVDITRNLVGELGISTGCEVTTSGLNNCEFPVGQTPNKFITNVTKLTIYPKFTRCTDTTDTKRCLICILNQWFVNSCSKLYSLPKLICPELKNLIFLKPGSVTSNIVWDQPTVDVHDRETKLKTYDNSIKSGDNVPSGFYSLIYSATNNIGLTKVCSREFQISDIKCVLPPIPDGGTRACNGSSIGSICQYQCYTGYYMDKQYNIITCGLNRKFDKPSPKCLNRSPPKITCFPPTNHIISVDLDNLTAMVTWKFPIAVDQSGEIIQPSRIHQVSSKYASGDVIPRGLHYIQYDVIDINGATDSCSFSFEMKFNQCHTLKKPANGNITCDSTDFRQDTHCVYGCNPGYNLHGFTVLTCQNTETYDYPEPSCHVMRCPEPSQLSSNSYVSCSNSNNINSTCLVSCQPGFNLISSHNTTSCLPTGNWNMSFPSCTDSESPVFISCPQTNIFQHYDSRFEQSVPAIWPMIIATDNSNEEITPTVTEGKDSGELFFPGVTRIKYRAADSKYNAATCQFHVIVSALDIGCAPGTRFNENLDNCVRCAVGFYQDADNALNCKPCPEGFTTRSFGAFQNCTKVERLLSRNKRSSASCSEPVFFNDPTIQFKCTGYDLNDVCQLSCMSGIQPTGSNRIVCVFDFNTGKMFWLSESNKHPRCRPQGDLIGMMCTICKELIPGANCCPINDLKHTDWMPMDFKEIKPQPPCEDFVAPATDHSYASILSGVKSYILNCPADNSLPRDVTTTTCDLNTGVWNPAPWLQDCTKIYYPVKYHLEATLSYLKGICSPLGVREQIKSKFTSLLNSAKNWQHQCPSSRKCSADDVMVFCSYYRRKRMDIRKRASTMYKTDVKWNFSIRLLEDELKGEKTKQLKDVLFQMFFGFVEDIYGGMFDQILDFNLDYSSLNMGQLTYVCDDKGGIYDTTTKTCLVCSSGSKYDVKKDRCVECPQGYYQDQENSMTCFQCPPGTTTQYTGSKYHTQCQVQCAAGFFSANGFLPCLPCPSRGTSSTGSTKCQHKHPLPQIQDFCANSSCVSNNHTCQNLPDGYRCNCKLGYRGQDCNITINPCTYINCENAGSCEASSAGTTICRCPTGYTGDYCQTKTIKDEDRVSTWTDWGSWGSCRTQPECGQGIHIRSRICSTDLKGTQCPGTDTDSRECNKIGCPICREEHLELPYSIKLNCNWTKSSALGVSVLVCNVSCREGYTPLYNVSRVTCKYGIWTFGLAKNICIVEPEWSNWSPWSNCPSVCDGERQRTRWCNNPPFYSGPPLCQGDNFQRYPCRRDFPDRKCSKCSMTDLIIPRNVNVSCTEMKGILTCVVSCQSTQVLFNEFTLDHAYTCNQGIWSPSNNVLPCTDLYQPLAVSKMITATYPTNCTDKSKIWNITSVISQNMETINSLPHQLNVQNPHCISDELTVTISIKMNIGNRSADYYFTYFQAISSVAETILHQRVFDINITTDLMVPVAVTEISQLHCPENTVAKSAYCVKCPAGSYYHLDDCLPCSLGTYQPSAGQCSCIRCPFRTTTQYLGSVALLACRHF